MLQSKAPRTLTLSLAPTQPIPWWNHRLIINFS